MNIDIFRKRIEAYLKSTSMARSKLEREANLTNSTISYILNGNRKNPTIDTVIKIADVIGCPLDELFGRKVEAGKVSYSKGPEEF